MVWPTVYLSGLATSTGGGELYGEFRFVSVRSVRFRQRGKDMENHTEVRSPVCRV